MPIQNLYIQDTIVASASAAGIGGINVIRVSGPDVEMVAKAVLGEIPKARMATYKKFLNEKKDLLDNGGGNLFPGSKPFT